MSRFDSHFIMSEADAIEYVKEKLDFFDKDARLSCKEIGDGNINYIFRIADESTGKSLVIKQAGTATRSSGTKLSMDRNRIETEILQLEGKLAPGMVPEVYLYDPAMACVVMEDLSDHIIMRYGLIEHKKYPLFAGHISDFLVKTLLPTTDIVLHPKEKKEHVARYINIDLCDISERLVYTEPYTNLRGTNKLFEPNREFVERELYGDTALHLEVGKLKNAFQNNAQALIHGDLHTGSIFVREDSTKVIDPEFAFYGPMGYDVGNVIANLFFAFANALVTIDDAAEREDYAGWVLETVGQVVDLFKQKFVKLYDETATDVYARTEGFLDWYLGEVLADSAGVAGLEMHRRVVGTAKVKDIAGIEDAKRREQAERFIILLGKRFIKERYSFADGKSYIAAARTLAADIGRL